MRNTSLLSLLVLGALMLTSFDWGRSAELKVQKLLALLSVELARRALSVESLMLGALEIVEPLSLLLQDLLKMLNRLILVRL